MLVAIEGYFSARYPEGKIYTESEAEACGRTAFKLADITMEELDISIGEMDKEFGELKIFSRLMK